MLIIGCPIQWDRDGDRCSSSRRALNVECAALLGAEAHFQQAECFRSGLLHTCETSAVVFDLQTHLLSRLFKRDTNLGGLCMPRYVGQAVFGGYGTA